MAFGERAELIRQILRRPDQERVRSDLRTFFGPEGDAYLATYEKMLNAGGEPRLNVVGWSWPAFLIGFTWFFYRKLYGLGALVLFLPLLLGYLIGSAGGSGIAIFIAMTAKRFYVQSALGRLAKADALGLAGAEREDYLRRAGGASIVAGVFAGIVYAALLGFAVYAALSA